MPLSGVPAGTAAVRMGPVILNGQVGREGSSLILSSPYRNSARMVHQLGWTEMQLSKRSNCPH